MINVNNIDAYFKTNAEGLVSGYGLITGTNKILAELEKPTQPWSHPFLPPMTPGFRDRLGRCYELAGRRILHHEADFLIHGTIQSPGNAALDHAWTINADGAVAEPASGRTYTAEAFDRLFHPVPRITYTAEAARAEMRRTEHFGPWDK